MTGFKKSSSVVNQPFYNSLYVNPLNEIKPNQIKEGSLNPFLTSDNKENTTPNIKKERFCSKNKENVVIPLSVNNGCSSSGKEKLLLEEKSDYSSTPPSSYVGTSTIKTKSLKPSSLQLCMQFNEPDSSFGLNIWDPLEETETKNENPSKTHVWDFSDSEAAPASSWSTLPNRSLLCRPLPVDIGRCTCVIVKEASLEELNGGSVYSLYTNEGKGRQDRKLAMAHHRKRNGRSEFTIAQNIKGLLCSSDESFLGTINANFMGSKYHIWDKGNPLDSLKKQSKLLLAVAAFVPTIATCTGSFRTLKAWIPKHQSMQLKTTTTQIQHINGLPKDWESNMNRAHQLFSRVPQYNKFSKQFELDFRERVKSTGLRIQSSAKNFQLTMEENGRQSILQLGRVGKSQYVMDYRYPLTGYQAFCICLASIDSKLCCMV